MYIVVVLTCGAYCLNSSASSSQLTSGGNSLPMQTMRIWRKVMMGTMNMQGQDLSVLLVAVVSGPRALT